MQDNELFANIEPWDCPVSGVELADEICGIFKKYLFLPAGAADALTMWILHTYAMECFDFTPRLCITSPEPRCGKTTLLSLLEYLSFKPINVSSITPAAMFRIIEQYQPTLMIDEADTFLNNNDDLRGIINTGYKRDGKVIRAESTGKKFEPKTFNCFAACAIAAIGKIPETIKDRGIVLIMTRKTRGENIQALRTREIKPLTIAIQRKCMRFITDNVDRIAQTRPIMPTGFNDRAIDIWEPLYAIASVISPEWLARINTASRALVAAQSGEDGTSIRVQLLQDIRQVFADKGIEWISSVDLVFALNEIEESPWGEWGHGRGLSVHSLAGQLKYFHIQPTQTRKYSSRSRGYDLSSFADSFVRFLPSEHSDCATVPPAAESEPAQTGNNPQIQDERHDGTIDNDDWLNEIPDDMPY